MATISDLELLNKEKDEDFEDGGEEILVENDMQEALDWLNKCMHLLDYMSDTLLCKSITKRERETMGRVSEGLRGFLDDIGSHYAEDDDSEE